MKMLWQQIHYLHLNAGKKTLTRMINSCYKIGKSSDFLHALKINKKNLLDHVDKSELR